MSEVKEVSSLLKRVQTHVRGQRTSGQATLAILVETIEHFAGPSGDWSPLAYLLGKSEKAQQNACRLIARNVIFGWKAVQDESQRSGIRFSKVRGTNQGFDFDVLKKLKAAVEAKKTIQSADVLGMFRKETAETAFDPMAWAEKMGKTHKNDLAAMIAALKEVARKASAS